jgi:hypothetical protein
MDLTTSAEWPVVIAESVSKLFRRGKHAHTTPIAATLKAKNFLITGQRACAVAELDPKRWTSGDAGAAFALAATALRISLTLLPVALTPRRVGSSLTDAERCQRAPYEGCSHQLERLTSRDAAAGHSSSQLVEGVLSCFSGHAVPSFPQRAGLVSPAVLYNATTLASIATRRTPK